MITDQAQSKAGGSLREVIGLVAVALIVRAVLFALRGDYLDWDEALYLVMARSILAGEGLMLNGYPHTALGPFVPFVAATLSFVTGLEPHLVHRALNVVAGAFLIVPVHYLIKLNGSERAALIASILLIAWPGLIDVAPKLGPMWRHMYAGTEPLFLFFLFAAFALGEFGLRKAGTTRYAALAGSGFTLACSYLNRPEAVVVALAYATARLLPSFRRETARELATAAAIVVAAALVFVGPYLYGVKQATGTWSPSGKLGPTRLVGDLYQDLVRDDRYMGAYLEIWWALEPEHRDLLNPYWGYDPSLPSQERMSLLRDRVEAARPVAAGSPLFKRVAAYGASLWTLTGLLLLPLAVVGLISQMKTPVRSFPPFVIAGFAASVATALAVYAMPRFFLYLIPALALWAANGIIGVATLPRRRRLGFGEFGLAAIVALLVLVLGGAGTLSGEAKGLRERALDNRYAAERLAATLAAGERVIAWHPRLAYWGRWDWRALPVASFDATVHYATERDARYLLLAHGMVSPLSLTVPYVVIEVPSDLRASFRNYALRPRSEESTLGSHQHPPLLLDPVSPLAGHPTGRVHVDDQ